MSEELLNSNTCSWINAVFLHPWHPFELCCPERRVNMQPTRTNGQRTWKSKALWLLQVSSFCTSLIADLIWECHAWTANGPWLLWLESHWQDPPVINTSLLKWEQLLEDDISDLFSVWLLHLKTAVIPRPAPMPGENNWHTHYLLRAWRNLSF